ncbi:MAG: class I SAM-dependent methyltransferase [Clostridiales bacterium]|nr:class I SAM-dependent methyltransferase [Clostridiales bacterium]
MDHMTAKVSCFARAYHYKNNRVHIFKDSAAKLLLGSDYEQIAQNMMNGIGFFLPDFTGTREEGLRLIVDKQLSPSVLGRSAFCEKMLEREKNRGCKQYMIFASGYDTYSLRNADQALSVFEMDLPELLTDKIERIKRTGIKTDAVFVSCNLAERTWKEKLLQEGYMSTKKSFGSLLGISYYLRKEEFRSLLQAVSELMVDGSVICFDYPSKEESKETKANQMLAMGAGEQMKALYDDSELEELLSDCGFEITVHLNHEEMTTQYFDDYNNCNSEYAIKAPVGVGYVLAERKTDR